MKTIGRVDLSHSLKQYFELVGQFPLTLGEGIVPAAIVADLNRTPFALDLPFFGTVSVGATAAEYSYVAIRPTGLPVNSWATIDRVIIFCGTVGLGLLIDPYLLTGLPVLTAGGTVKAMRRRNVNAEGAAFAEVDFLAGTSATVPSADGLYNRTSTLDSFEVAGPWAISAGGALVVAVNTANVLLVVSALGRVHYTSAK